MKSKHQITHQEAQVKIETLCARAEHSSGEVIDRLRRWGISSRDIANIVQSLIHNRFIDDRRFAKAYATDKIKFARWGKRKVFQGLKLKKIDSEIIRDTLAGIDDTMYASILETILRIKIEAKPELITSYEGRTRLFRFAASRGFEPQLCSMILRKIIDNINAES